MKKWKKGAALLMAAGLMSTSLTGCGQLLQNAVSAAKEAAEESADAVAEEGNVNRQEAPEQTEQPTSQPTVTASSAPALAKRFFNVYETADDNYTTLVMGKCETPVLTAESAEQYPALATSLDAYTKEQMKSYNDTIADYKEQAEQEYKDAPERFQDGMYYSTNYKVLPQRVDDTVVSFFSSYNDFTGGAHGMYGMQGENFNTQTGEKLMLSDVLNDLSNLNELIKTELLANYDPEQFDDLDNALSYYDVAVTESTATADNDMGYVFPYDWALTPNGIAFYFAPYSLAAYAAGDQMVTLSYDRYADIFNPDYLPASGSSFMVPFEWILNGYDINGDGKPNTITLDYDYDENYEAREALRMTVDGMGSASTDGGQFGTDYEVTGYYVRTGDGRQYIYATENVENDYQDWYVFDLNGSEITYAGTTWFVRTVEVDSEDNVSERMLTNPEDMVLANRFDFLSSFSAVKDYYPGPDGMPVSDEPYYYVYYDCAQEPLVAKTQLAYTVLDSNGEETGETGELNPGDTFRVYRTDGEKVLDVTLSDGTLGRLTITSADYPCKIDGITDEDCVEQLWYAG